jgi:hypothetical protein
MMMTIEEMVDQFAHDWMKERCPNLYLVIESQVMAGTGKEAILSFCSGIRGANEFILAQAEGTIERLRRERAAWQPICPHMM